MATLVSVPERKLFSRRLHLTGCENHPTRAAHYQVFFPTSKTIFLCNECYDKLASEEKIIPVRISSSEEKSMLKSRIPWAKSGLKKFTDFGKRRRKTFDHKQEIKAERNLCLSILNLFSDKAEDVRVFGGTYPAIKINYELNGISLEFYYTPKGTPLFVKESGRIVRYFE